VSRSNGQIIFHLSILSHEKNLDQLTAADGRYLRDQSGITDVVDRFVKEAEKRSVEEMLSIVSGDAYVSFNDPRVRRNEAGVGSLGVNGHARI